MNKYYTIPDHLLPLASSFERFQMARFGNVLVLQDGYNPTREEEKEKEWSADEQRLLIENERL
jgi:hypothetical protein